MTNLVPDEQIEQLARDYHEHGYIKLSGFFSAEEVDKLIDPARAHKMETKPGDVLIFHSLTPHRSGKNTADYSRRSLYLTYNAAHL